jgi:hypothetical protein
VSTDATLPIKRSDFNVQSKVDHQNPNRRWTDESAVRLYSESPYSTALQIRGVLATPSKPPAYAVAHLTDDDLLWLARAAIRVLEERGVGFTSALEVVRTPADPET